MKKVYLGVGHGGSDPGAVGGGWKESDMNLNTALACKEFLELVGVSVMISRVDNATNAINNRVLQCNRFAPDCAVDIHYNAGGGDGWEAYAYPGSTRSTDLAASIQAQVLAIGQNSRGVKNGARFLFCNSVNAPSLLLEGAFVDSSDIQFVDTVEKQQRMGIAYAKGLCDYLGVVYDLPSPQPPIEEGIQLPDKEYGITTQKCIVFDKPFGNPLSEISEKTEIEMTAVQVVKGLRWYNTNVGGWIDGQWIVSRYEEFTPPCVGVLHADAFVFRAPEQGVFREEKKGATIAIRRSVKNNGLIWFEINDDEYIDAQWVDIKNEVIDPPYSGILLVDACVFETPFVGSFKVEEKGTELQLLERSVVKGVTWYRTDLDGWIDGQLITLK